MFTAPVNDVLNALANASLFAAAKDDQPCLTGVRLRVTGNDLEVIATDRYVIGQARVAGEGTGPDFTELVHPAGLKRVTAVLKKNLGAAVTIEQDGEILRFTIGSETVNVTHMDADVFHYPAVERMFNIPSGPGANYTHIAPKHLALLGKMRDYTLKAADQPGLTLTTGKTRQAPAGQLRCELPVHGHAGQDHRHADRAPRCTVRSRLDLRRRPESRSISTERTRERPRGLRTQ